MNTKKIRQTIALVILCAYFVFKILGVFDIHVISNKEKSKQSFIYLIDSGHGYYGENCGDKAVLDEENRCFYEWIYNWNIRTSLAQMLDSAGIEYHFINIDTLSDMPLKQRVSKANNIKTKKPKILISIHANASANLEAKGFEVYSPKGQYSQKYFYKDKKQFSDSLANIMYQCLELEFPEHTMRYENKTQDYKEAAFTIISKTKCYAILTENEFFTNENIRKKMRTKEFKQRVAKAHFEFIRKVEKMSKK